MNDDLIEVKAVINERIRMNDKIELGRGSNLAVRREVEDATYIDGGVEKGPSHSLLNWNFMERVKRMRTRQRNPA